MRFRSLAGLGLLLVCSATWAQVPVPKPWKPEAKPSQPATPAPAGRPLRDKNGKPLHFIDGVPDTGQFLPDSVVLGRIDDRLFRVGEFRERWYASYLPDRPKNDSTGRCEFLNSMVNKEVLAALARQVNRPLGFEDRAKLRETQQRMLSNAVFVRLVADSVRVTRADVEHLYTQSGLRLHLRQIITNEPASAERARADILAHRLSWSEAVKKYSTGRGDKGPDGDLGWLLRGDFAALPAMEIFDLADGQTSGVHSTEDGWQFVQVLERRPEKQPVFDVVARGLGYEIRDVKLAERVDQVRAVIRAQIGMVYDSTNISWASALFAVTERQKPIETKKTVIDLSGGPQPEFQPADTSRLLAHWKDGRYTLREFLSAYNDIPPMQRDKLGTFNAFRSTLDRFVFEPYMAELGREHGLEQDSLVTTQVARTEEQIRVEHLFADSVESRVWVTPQERMKYYQDHQRGFVAYQNVKFAALVRPSKAGADSLAARLKAGESAASILRADSLAGFNSGSIRSLREDETGQPYFKLLFEEMRPGNVEITGPDKEGFYLVLQKLTHEPNRQMSFEEVEAVVDESVQNLKAESALKQLVERHRKGHRIELHPELVMRIPLVDPASR